MNVAQRCLAMSQKLWVVSEGKKPSAVARWLRPKGCKNAMNFQTPEIGTKNLPNMFLK